MSLQGMKDAFDGMTQLAEDQQSTIERLIAELHNATLAAKQNKELAEKYFAQLAEADRLLRKHRFCGDDYPRGGWPDINVYFADRYFADQPTADRETAP